MFIRKTVRHLDQQISRKNFIRFRGYFSGFEDKEQARECFNRLTAMFRDWNYTAEGSELYQQQLASIEATAGLQISQPRPLPCFSMSSSKL